MNWFDDSDDDIRLYNDAHRDGYCKGLADMLDAAKKCVVFAFDIPEADKDARRNTMNLNLDIKAEKLLKGRR